MCVYFRYPFIYSIIHISTVQFASGSEALGGRSGQFVEHFIIGENQHIKIVLLGNYYVSSIVHYSIEKFIGARHSEVKDACRIGSTIHCCRLPLVAAG